MAYKEVLCSTEVTFKHLLASQLEWLTSQGKCRSAKWSANWSHLKLTLNYLYWWLQLILSSKVILFKYISDILFIYITYSTANFSCQELDERIDAILMSVW